MKGKKGETRWLFQTKKEKVCPSCHNESTNPKARFCWNCGAKILTEKEEIVERLQNLMSLTVTMPESARDVLQVTVLDAVKFIEGGLTK